MALDGMEGEQMSDETKSPSHLRHKWCAMRGSWDVPSIMKLEACRECSRSTVLAKRGPENWLPVKWPDKNQSSDMPGIPEKAK